MLQYDYVEVSHHCSLHAKSLVVHRQFHCLSFIYKALIGPLPSYVAILVNINSNSYYSIHSYNICCVLFPKMRTEERELLKLSFFLNVFNVFFQKQLKLQTIVVLSVLYCHCTNQKLHW